ncbi:hypothetical protein Tco_0133044 [Tanacetum coccineum]
MAVSGRWWWSINPKGLVKGDDGRAWVDTCGGELVVPRLSDKFGGELMVILVGEDSLDDPKLMMVQGADSFEVAEKKNGGKSDK